MSRTLIHRSIASVLILAFVVPAVFFIQPNRASAQVVNLAAAASCLGLIGQGANLAATAVTSVLAVPVSDFVTRMQTTTTAGATSQDCVVTTILQPLARLLARMILQQITASTINWINGGNSTGQPSYVQNISLHLQSVGDTSALAFFSQLGTNLSSPFTSAIVSSLRVNYLQNTSSAGFFAANQNTLAKYSSNVNSFLSGNWSQGGIGAWFALTTQNQNNPYTFYQAAQTQLASVVGSAQGVRQQELLQGQGFLPWCEGDAKATVTGSAVNPQVACKNADGTTAKTLTPGSVIHDYTQQAVVNSGISQLVAANDLDSALSAIISALGKQVLGAAGGLFGASQSSPTRPTALTTQLTGYTGSTGTANSSSNSIVQSVLNNIATFTTAWTTIKASATTASASVDSLVAYCSSQQTQPNASQSSINVALTAAQIARTTEIDPLIARAQTAIDSTAATRAFAAQVQGQIDSGATTGASAAKLSTDIQTLSTMSPLATEALAAQQNAQPFGGAGATPSGSLSVSGGSLVDQMNLISSNAAAFQASCNPVTPTTVVNDNGGG